MYLRWTLLLDKFILCNTNEILVTQYLLFIIAFTLATMYGIYFPVLIISNYVKVFLDQCFSHGEHLLPIHFQRLLKCVFQKN